MGARRIRVTGGNLYNSTRGVERGARSLEADTPGLTFNGVPLLPGSVKTDLIVANLRSSRETSTPGEVPPHTLFGDALLFMASHGSHESERIQIPPESLPLLSD